MDAQSIGDCTKNASSTKDARKSPTGDASASQITINEFLNFLKTAYQIQQLQSSMQDIVKVMTVFSQTAPLNQHLKENGIATQTEIVAVHTPQGDAGKVFPFQKQTRPSSLPLPVHQRKKENSTSTNPVNSELKEFADSLVDGVIKTVSETKADCLGIETTEITITDTDKISKENDKDLCDAAA